ncbi:MAG: hypothetical protein Q8R92_21170 [Deltaproteobacteria bacterium]|nr:hypothetical protein [Deltaproteobacteria bacterium]
MDITTTASEFAGLLARLHLTGEDLAALLDVSVPTVSYWRTGRRTDRRRGGEVSVVAPRAVMLLLSAWEEHPELLAAARSTFLAER